MAQRRRQLTPAAVFILGLWLTLPAAGLADTFSGAVVGVIDGDTIDVMHNGAAARIRLIGIDCPEKGQAFGQRAKQAASGLAFGKTVTVMTTQHDRYDRQVANASYSAHRRSVSSLTAVPGNSDCPSSSANTASIGRVDRPRANISVASSSSISLRQPITSRIRDRYGSPKSDTCGTPKGMAPSADFSRAVR